MNFEEAQLKVNNNNDHDNNNNNNNVLCINKVTDECKV